MGFILGTTFDCTLIYCIQMACSIAHNIYQMKLSAVGFQAALYKFTVLSSLTAKTMKLKIPHRK